MKYMLLIHQGATPIPPSEEWERLSDDEKGAVYAAYKAINETPGVTPGVRMQPPAQPGHQSHPPRSHAGGEDPSARRA